MNICILTSRFPYPEMGGDSLRINNVAKYLKRNGHRLILITFYGEKEPDIKTASELYDRVEMVKLSRTETLLNSFLYLLRKKPIQVGYYYSSRLLKRLQSVIGEEEIDLFIPHALRMTEYIIKTGQQGKTIVEQTDVNSKAYALSKKGKGNLVKKLFFRIENKLIPRYEEFMLRVFPKIVYVSPSDVSFLKKKYPWENVAVCHTNGFDIPQEISKEYNPHKICLMGNMRTLPNQDAAIFFVQEVLPIIIKEDPDVLFYIIGAEPSKQIQELASDHVIVTGFVESVEKEMADACLCVAPVRIAAGIQNKILVSMGCGVPVILSSLISQPIPKLKNWENCVIEDDPQKIAEDCLKLMRDEKLRNALGLEGRMLIQNDYTWNETLKGYEFLEQVNNNNIN